jgi:hypothetical protein
LIPCAIPYPSVVQREATISINRPTSYDGALWEMALEDQQPLPLTFVDGSKLVYPKIARVSNNSHQSQVLTHSHLQPIICFPKVEQPQIPMDYSQFTR